MTDAGHPGPDEGPVTGSAAPPSDGVGEPGLEEPTEAADGADSAVDATAAGDSIVDAQPEPPADGGDGSVDPAALAAALAEARAERDAYLEALQRARADYDNLAKRKQRELEEALDRGAARLADRLLEVLDNFSYALKAAEDSGDERLAKGVGMVHAQLRAALTEAGLEEVPGTGAPFDPIHHEAVAHAEGAADGDGPEVAEVLRTGYLFKGRVLRPASVKVIG